MRVARTVIPVSVRRIIVGCDEGPGATDALRFASVVARATRADLILANVHHGHDAEARRLLAAVERTVPYGTRAEMRAIEGRSPAHGLHALAESERADLIVVGPPSHNKRGQSPFVTGAHCPVAIAPTGFADDPDPGLRVIGVAFDASPESEHALAMAADLALASRAALKLIGVAEPPPRPTVGMAAMYVPDPEVDYRGLLQGELEAAADELPISLRAQVVLADGDVAAQLVKRAAPLSLLVMGSRGYGPFRRALLGSVSAHVLRSAQCPVVVVPRGAAKAGGELEAVASAA